MVKDIRRRDEENMKEIEKIIKEIDTLKPVSYIRDKIMKIISNPDSSLAEHVGRITANGV